MKKSLQNKSKKPIKKMKKRSTSKRRSCNKQYIVKTFMELLNVVKLYHWKTDSFPVHQNTGRLHERLEKHIDEFVEVFLGKDGSRNELWNKEMEAIQYKNLESFKGHIYEFRRFLINLGRCMHKKKDADLLNILDEILVDVNRFLYLLTFH